jgi:hypothetical protein
VSVLSVLAFPQLTLCYRLVVGGVDGQLSKAFNRIAKIHTKLSLDFALIVGDVFSDGDTAQGELDQLLDGSTKPALLTYFTVGDHALPGKIIARLEDSPEVVPNLVYLGRKGTFTTSEGIRIVSVGGRLVENEQSVTQALGNFDPLFLDADVKGLRGAHSAHILLTNQWPANIARLSSLEVPEGVEKSTGAQPLATLSQALKPWYHFSSSPAAMWEREVFKQPEEYGSLEESKYTRFKSLASIGNIKEWSSAFSIDTSKPPPAERWTEHPFLNGTPPRKRAHLPDQERAYDQYNGRRGGGVRGRRAKRPRMENDECFMCLTKPNFKDYLVASIAEDSIVTAMRGPLPLKNTFPDLSFTGHAMIIPIFHAEDEMQGGQRAIEDLQREFTEMTKYRKALSKMFVSKSDGRLGAVCYEVNRTGIRHFHWQVLPVEAEKIRRGLIEGAFKLASEKHKYEAFQECDPEKLLEQRSDFFRVWTWIPTADPVARADAEANGEDGDVGVIKCMYFPIPGSARFNVSFGREVMAGILQLEDRVDWWRTLLPDEAEERKVEEADAEGLKEDFAEFDFAMN